MYRYEFIRLDNNNPSAEEVTQQIKSKRLEVFESPELILDFVAEAILMDKYFDWEVYNEVEGVCIAVREEDIGDFEVFRVRVCTQSTHILIGADFEGEEE